MSPLIVPVDGIDLVSTLRTVVFLANDPTVDLRPGRFRRVTHTPDGPGTIVVTWADDDRARVETHGDGASWLAERAPRLLGCEDDVDGFEPVDEPLRTLWRRHRGDRIPRTGTLWHDLAWSIVQQRITTVEAGEQWRRLVLDIGSPAPGADDLSVPPDPATVARLHYTDLHHYGIERQRADHLRRAAARVERFARSVDDDPAEALAALGTVPGIGPWTRTCLATQTWGQRDTVIVGDAGIPSMVAWLLARERRADDARLLELLEPHRPHRHRVIRLAFASGARPPRRQHRAPRRDIRRR